MKYFIVLSLLILSISCAANNLQTNSDLFVEKNIGWMHGNCLVIKNQDIKIPADITLVKLEANNTTEKATIISKTTSQEDCFPLLEDRRKINISSGYSFYLVKSVVPIDLAIGVIGSEELNVSNFSYCTTIEGIKYLIKDSSTVIWEGYYYLGYDSEVTCTF